MHCSCWFCGYRFVYMVVVDAGIVDSGFAFALFVDAGIA